MTQLANRILSYVNGDLEAYAELKRHPQDELVASMASARIPLQVTATSLRTLLARYRTKEVDPESLQQWASFIRRGYFPSKSSEAVKPIPIAYEAEFDEPIADTVSRLDEIGDSVDGALTEEEVSEFQQALSRLVENKRK
jgi:hypothetical protein